MCIRPVKLADGQMISCRECWQCRQRKIDDWVGRCIAEGKTAVGTSCVTLTYGADENGDTDHIRAAILTYSDVQGYFKRLRANGFPLRYFVVGEYGKEKGRAHWHAILFWQKKIPPHELRTNFMERHWPHGYSFWDENNDRAIRYACKYLQKDLNASERQGHMALSKKPPLGDAYFKILAKRYVEQGLAPQDLFYSFPEGKGKRYMMQGVTADNFLREFLELWELFHGTWPPYSEVIEEYQDRMAPPDLELRWTKPVFDRIPKPKSPPMFGTMPKLDPVVKAYYSDTENGRLWYSHNTEGDLVWHEKVRSAEGEEIDWSALRPESHNYRQQSRGQ